MAKLKRLDDDEIDYWLNYDYSEVEKTNKEVEDIIKKQVEEDAKKENTNDRANKQGGNAEGWFGIGNSILNNLGGIFSGIGSIVGASKGTPQNAYYIEEKDNSGIGTYLIIGGVVLAVVVVVIVLVARK
ncbi:MAG: hypothetical protein IJU33_02205 [Bacteroidales bacterium]|nr:hypothetical protein [Bacteroidales bacterium]